MADTIKALYDYTDGAGKLLFQVVRYEPKGFRQRRPDGKGGWIWNLDGVFQERSPHGAHGDTGSGCPLVCS